jgi:Raf kinase inhibitor-like YbhB/YbcL family protein
MKKLGSALFAAALVAALPAAAADFKLTSADVKAGGTIDNTYVFKGFGCAGDTMSPALAWSGAPAGTKSFAITVYDPDAPTGSGWWHWTVANIPPTNSGLVRGAGDAAGKGLPAGAVQTRTDFGAPGYGGPCPPQGDKPHRYVFTVYALKVDKLDIDANASAALLGFMIHFNTLGKATFTSTYGRK